MGNDYFYVTDVVVQTRLVTVKNGMGGNIINIQNLDVPITRIMMIDPYSSKNADNLYAIWVGISKKLDQLWADDSYAYLKVSVYCSNERNISKVLTNTIIKNMFVSSLVNLLVERI